MDTSMPYSAMPSPSATKISALPKLLGSSVSAPMAAGAPAPTAMPAPMPAMPVDRAAAMRPSPLPAEAAARLALGESRAGQSRRQREGERQKAQSACEFLQRTVFHETFPPLSNAYISHPLCGKEGVHSCASSRPARTCSGLKGRPSASKKRLKIS